MFALIRRASSRITLPHSGVGLLRVGGQRTERQAVFTARD